MSHPIYYRRHLPHYHPVSATYHIVCRLAGTLPQALIVALASERLELSSRALTSPDRGQLELAQQRNHFVRIERVLDAAAVGPTWLAQPAIAEVVVGALRNRAGDSYDLYAYSLMPNHLHVVLSPLMTKSGTTRAPNEIIGSLKKYTARRANAHLGRKGAFWQAESFDRAIRDDDELRRTVLYVVNNPVKAGLVREPGLWPYSYVKGWGS